MAGVRLHLLAVGTGLGLVAVGLLWAAAPAPRPAATLVIPAGDRLVPAAPQPAEKPAPPAAAPARTEVLLYVQPGEDAAQVVAQLAAAGLVGNGVTFTERLTALHDDGQIQPGAYTLWRGMSEGELAQRLVQGP